MKRIGELIKPYISIIFGALLFLYYLNWLSYEEEALAIGIAATVVSSYYLVAGILGVILGEKLGKVKNIFDIISLALFPAFMFSYYLIITIEMAEIFKPTGWVIAILSMVGSIVASAIFVVNKLIQNKLVNRLTFLFAAIFALVLLLNILFGPLDIGTPVVLGMIDVILFVAYLAFSYMLFVSLGKPVEETKSESK